MEEKTYHDGVLDGIKQTEERILKAYQNGTPLEVQGRAYWIKGDIENLRDLMDDMKEE